MSDVAIKLPHAGTTRWVKSRKLEILTALEFGHITEDRVQEVYGITPAEISEWRALLLRHGAGSLRVTHTTSYRRRRHA